MQREVPSISAHAGTILSSRRSDLDGRMAALAPGRPVEGAMLTAQQLISKAS
jgi:hypothetical protein